MRSLSVISVLLLLTLMGCEKEESILQVQDYNNRVWGEAALSAAVRVIVISNPAGSLIITGAPQDSTVGWFMDQWVTLESQVAADAVFHQIRLEAETAGDSLLLWVQGAPAMTSRAGVSLTIPEEIPCVVRQVRGTTTVSYLHSEFLGEHVGLTSLDGQEGSCILNGSNGDVAIEISLPDSGQCRVSVTNGDITLHIPTGTSSMLSAVTGSGRVTSSGLAVLDSVGSPTSLTGKLGDGRGTIALTTTNGNITIAGF
jgi:hypothetical protein